MISKDYLYILTQEKLKDDVFWDIIEMYPNCCGYYDRTGIIEDLRHNSWRYGAQLNWMVAMQAGFVWMYTHFQFSCIEELYNKYDELHNSLKNEYKTCWQGFEQKYCEVEGIPPLIAACILGPQQVMELVS